MTTTDTTTTAAAPLAASLSDYMAEAQVFVTALGPVLPPKVGALLGLAFGAFNAAKAAASGQDVTDEQLQALFDQFAVNKADDQAAQAEALARRNAGGGTGTA